MLTIKVRFPNNPQDYMYFTDDNSIVSGDKVVVDSPRDGFKVVEVTQILRTTDSKATKPIVCKIDTTNYERLKKEIEIKNRAMEELKVMAKQFEELAVYELLARANPRAAELLKIVKGN